ncbi:MAG: ribonucleoside-triphosphate reductase, partial [Streblomastix strix]
KKNCEEDALLGVSLTGIAQKWDLLHDDDGQLLEIAAKAALDENAKWAKMLGINPAKRIGCTKPSGNTSALLGTTSGIHAAHAETYLRRVRVETNSPMANYFVSLYAQSKIDMESGMQLTIEEVAREADTCQARFGQPLIETDVYARQKNSLKTISIEGKILNVPHQIVVTMPVKMQGAIVRSRESAVQLLERAAFIHEHFIQKSHRSGPNYHNVSLTVNYKPRKTQMVKKIEQDKVIEQEVVLEEGEEEQILQWLFAHTDKFSGIALFPDISENTYPQMPFEEVDQQTFDEWQSAWLKLGQIAKNKLAKTTPPTSPLILSPITSPEYNDTSLIYSDEQSQFSSYRPSFAQLLEQSEKEDLIDPEECMNILKTGMERVAWDPLAPDKRKETLACAGGNCEVV